LKHNMSRFAVLAAAVSAFVALLGGSAQAVTIADCVDGGGIVVRCSERPVTREDKVTCPAPGKATRIWCVGGFYGGLEIIDFRGDSRYR
jgi:hypothetical protein